MGEGTERLDLPSRTESLEETPAAARAEAGLPRPGTLVDRFVILDQIGAGGMGVVYAAHDRRLDRKVAIKLLHPGMSAIAQARLGREAQVMARLSHPNVLTVHEAGTFGDRIFLVMELVPGATMADWLARAPRSPAEIVAAYLQAGRGLAAAHGAGIVHRDFKPSNVLVGDDGRVRVSDFGIAKTLADDDDASGGGEPAPDRSPLMTLPGERLGTPRYMAPEQREARRVDARSDQYAFALALREALGTRAPGWIQAILGRALDDDPARRYPSMAALLADLERDPAVRRRRLLVGLGIAAAAAAVALGGARLLAPGEVCRGAEQRLAGVWDPGVAAAVRRSFVATGRPYAGAIYGHVADRLDRYAAGWAAMHGEACRATAVRREQSAALLDLRMACLDRRLRALGALTALYAEKPDPGVLDRAVGAAAGLGDLAACADAAALTAAYPPPAETLAAPVAALRARLDRAAALQAAGRGAEALELARAIEADARAVAYPPLRADSVLLLGNLLKEAAPAEAETVLQQAIQAAAAARDDERMARAMTELIWVVGFKLHRADEARALRPLAEAAITRAGGDGAQRANLLFNLAVVENYGGRPADARRLHEEALSLRERLLGPDHQDTARSLNGLASVLMRDGKLDEARPLLERSVDIMSRTLHPDHPNVAIVLGNLCSIAEQQGKGEEALAYCRRSVDILERSLGPDHPSTSAALNNTAGALERLGRLDEAARVQERALAIREKALGPDASDVAATLTNLGELYDRLGRRDEALALLERALAIREKALGPDHIDVSWPLINLGELRLHRGEPALALPVLERLVALRTRLLGEGHAQTATARILLAECLLALGRAREAVAQAEQALPVLSAAGLDPSQLADTRFVLARALRATGGDRARARALAEEARAYFASAGPGRADDLRRVTSWLAGR